MNLPAKGNKEKKDNGLRNLLIGAVVLTGILLWYQQVLNQRKEAVWTNVSDYCQEMGGSAEDCYELADKVRDAM